MLLSNFRVNEVNEEAKRAKKHIGHMEMFLKDIKPVIFLLFLAGKRILLKM